MGAHPEPSLGSWQVDPRMTPRSNTQDRGRVPYFRDLSWVYLGVILGRAHRRLRWTGHRHLRWADGAYRASDMGTLSPSRMSP